MVQREILHVDMNNFYASIECLYHPELRGKPVAVAGDPAQRHGIVLAKNELAKKSGVQTASPLWKARQLCPEIIFVPPHHDLYAKYSGMARSIYEEYTDQVEPYGLDECWLDVTGSRRLFGSGREIADAIRARVQFELGISCSVGVSYNKIFAKLGSDMRKPDATTVLMPGDLESTIWPQPVDNLLFVGSATRTKLARYGIRTIGDLATADQFFLQRLLGKNGGMLWRFARGLDDSKVCDAQSDAQVKSISNSTTTPRDLLNDQEVKITLYALCESVAARLREAGMLCKTVQCGMRDPSLAWIERQCGLPVPSCCSSILCDAVFSLYLEHHKRGVPLRGLSVKACDVIDAQELQLSFLPEAGREQKSERLELAVDGIRRRYGTFALRRGIMLADTVLSDIDPKADHTVYPTPFRSGSV